MIKIKFSRDPFLIEYMDVNRMQELSYRIMLRKEPEGGYTVTVPSLPGCVTFGETLEEAIEMAREAIEAYIETLVAHGEAVPDEINTFEYTVVVKHDPEASGA
ncbi:MAG: type II toxin-antitoxin system HicB family antitoxin [Promethearchaeota archaeon]